MDWSIDWAASSTSCERLHASSRQNHQHAWLVAYTNAGGSFFWWTLRNGPYVELDAASGLGSDDWLPSEGLSSGMTCSSGIWIRGSASWPGSTGDLSFGHLQNWLQNFLQLRDLLPQWKECVIWFCHGRVMSRNKINELLTAKSSTFNHVLNTQQFRIGVVTNVFSSEVAGRSCSGAALKICFRCANHIVFPHSSNDTCSTIPLSYLRWHDPVIFLTIAGSHKISRWNCWLSLGLAE